jgi:hypothetical protein
MKKNNLFLLLLLLFSLEGNCQYNKTLTEGSVWNINHDGLAGFNYSQIIDGDTIVNGVVYKRYIEDAYTNSNSFLLLREDSTAKKIYVSFNHKYQDKLIGIFLKNKLLIYSDLSLVQILT